MTNLFGGVLYHGCSPIISLLWDEGYIETVAYPDDEKHVFESAKLFIETEGWLPAPVSSYSICCAIDEAIKCREANEEKVIAFNISGHGFPDIPRFSRCSLDLKKAKKVSQTSDLIFAQK